MQPPSPRAGDAPVLVDLDTGWIGVNERDDAASLQTEAGSYVTAAVNARFRTRRPETRGGYVKPKPMQSFEQSPFWIGTYCGAGTFTDSLGREWVALAPTLELDEGEDAAFMTAQFVRMGQHMEHVATEVGHVPWTRATFTQAGAEMILWRDNGEPLHWTGDFDDTWQASTEADVPGYASFLRPLPSAAFGIYMKAAARVVFPTGVPGEYGWTDIAAPRRWDATLSRATVATGALTGFAEWGRSLVVFTETSITAVTNFTGDLNDTSVDPVTDQAGCIAHATITQVGGDLIWLGRGGVYKLSETVANGPGGGLSNKRQMSPLPVSWLIPKSMDRINWSAAWRATATLADGLWYLSVPVDGSLTNNAVFVFDTVTGQWQGEDILEAWLSPGIVAMTKTTVFGAESPIFVAEDAVFAGGHGWHDGFGTGDIRTDVTFRGYALNDAGLKTLQRLEVQTEELGTAPALSALTDGIRGTQAVQTTQTRDRSRYLDFGRAARDLTNAGNDFAQANREDYAWVLGQLQIETATVVCTAGIITGSGNATVVITSTGMTGSPIALNVAVLLNDTATQVATKIRTALNANAVIAARFTIGGTGAVITLTRKAVAANDGALNVSIANGTCTGLTAAPTSGNTLAGGAGDGLILGAAGVPLGYMQRHKLGGMVRGAQVWVQPRVSCSKGRLRVCAVRAAGVKRRDWARRE